MFLEAGSYNLDALFTEGLPCGGSPENDGKPQPVRIDLAQDAQGQWFAAVAFSGQNATLFTAKASTETSLTLGGSASEYSWGEDGSYYASNWERFTLTASDAAPTGMAVHGEGHSNTSDGTVETCSNIAVALDGTLVPDTTAPTGHFEMAPRYVSPKPVLMPWYPVDILLSEPIAMAALQGALTVTSTVDGVSTTLPTTWDPDPGAVFGDTRAFDLAGARTLRTRNQDGMVTPWPDGASIQFAVAPGLTDPSGNAVVVPPVTFQVVDPGAPQPSHTFDSGAPPGLWGGAKHLPAGSADCESGGCVELPASGDPCATTQAGLTARLSVPASATQLNVRFRLYTSSEEWPSYAGAPEIEFTQHDSLYPPLWLAKDIKQEDLLALDPPQLPFLRRTAWRTYSTSILAMDTSEGITLSVVTSTGCWDQGEVRTRVLVDRIWVD